MSKHASFNNYKSPYTYRKDHFHIDYVSSFFRDDKERAVSLDEGEYAERYDRLERLRRNNHLSALVMRKDLNH